MTDYLSNTKKSFDVKSQADVPRGSFTGAFMHLMVSYKRVQNEFITWSDVDLTKLW